MTEYKFKIEKLLKDYDLGQLVSVDDQSHGYANINFGVRTTGRRVFVRFCRQQSIKDIEQEMLLMRVLLDNSFRTAYPVKRRDGKWISFSDDMPVVVYDYISGTLPSLNEKVVKDIAGEVAALSLIKYPAELNKKNAISPGDSRDIIRSEAFNSFSHRDVVENFTRLFSAIEDNLSLDLPVGIVHGDIFPDNTLFDEDRLMAIIDFEEFAVDKLLFDVGMTVNGFCFNGITFRDDLFSVFIKVYNGIRRLTGDELNLLTDYMCWGAVGMTSWHLHQLLYRKHRAQLKRVRVLLERADWILSSKEKIMELTAKALK